MFKKILGLAISVLVATSCVISAGADGDTAWKTEVLRGLGAYQENPVTYDGFINSLAGFLYDNPSEQGDAETIARTIGMIDAGEEYSGSSSITVEKACELAVITLGYKPLLGDDGNYMQKAAQLGIADGIIAKGADRLKADVAVEILYNMIEAEPMVKVYGGELSHGYSVAYDNSLLYLNREIYKVKGVMTGTAITSLFGEEYIAGKDSISIEDVSYVVGTSKYDSLLGKNVVAYVKEDSAGVMRALAVHELTGKNETVTVKCEDIIDIGNRISYINYYKSPDKSKKLNITVSPRVIYNGRFLEQYTEDDFRHGVLELIDNNSDGKFDVIKVSAYETIVVEAVDSLGMTIKNRYRYSGCIDELSLDTQKQDILYNIYDANGMIVNISDIKTDNVLSVLRSRDGYLIDIYIAEGKTAYGSVGEVDYQEAFAVIDGTEYDLSEDFVKMIADPGKSIKLGKSYTFMLDSFGRIAYFKETAKNNYYVLLKVYPDEFGEEYCAVYMDMNGDWYTASIAQKVRIDGVRPQTSLQDAMNNLKNELPQVLIFEFNSDNKIINIDKAGNYTATNETDFCKKPSMKYTYRGDDRYFHSGNDIVYLEDDAKVIVFPTGDDIKDKNAYKIYSAGSFFKYNGEYSVECYNPDDFMFCDLFTVAQSTEVSRANLSKSLYVITGFKHIAIDGEAYPVVMGSVDGFMNLSFIGRDSDTFRGYNIGDVVNFSLDQSGNIDYIEKKFSLTNFAPMLGAVYSETSLHAGKVIDIDYDKGKMKVDCGNNTVIPFRLNTAMQVTVFNEKEECESKPISSISRYDDILLRTSYGKIEELICVKN